MIIDVEKRREESTSIRFYLEINLPGSDELTVCHTCIEGKKYGGFLLAQIKVRWYIEICTGMVDKGNGRMLMERDLLS